MDQQLRGLTDPAEKAGSVLNTHSSPQSSIFLVLEISRSLLASFGTSDKYDTHINRKANAQKTKSDNNKKECEHRHSYRDNTVKRYGDKDIYISKRDLERSWKILILLAY